MILQEVLDIFQTAANAGFAQTEEYCNAEVPFDKTESGEKLYTKNDLKQAFFSGLKAGRPQWHNVADADLPKEKKEYWCKVFYYEP